MVGEVGWEEEEIGGSEAVEVWRVGELGTEAVSRGCCCWVERSIEGTGNMPGFGGSSRFSGSAGIAREWLGEGLTDQGDVAQRGERTDEKGRRRPRMPARLSLARTDPPPPTSVVGLLLGLLLSFFPFHAKGERRAVVTPD